MDTHMCPGIMISIRNCVDKQDQGKEKFQADFLDNKSQKLIED